MPEHDLLWAYLIMVLVVLALVVMASFWGLTGFFLDLAWQRLKPFLLGGL